MSFQSSPTTAKLDEALANAQGEIYPATKDKENEFFDSKYADLAGAWKACREALSKHKISVTQWPIHSTDGRLHLMTRLAHAGEWMTGYFSIPVQKNDAHGMGSAVTYARRFGLMAALGLVADEDDDGNGAVTTQRGSKAAASAPSVKIQGSSKPSPVKPVTGSPAKEAQPWKISDSQVRRVYALAKEGGMDKDALKEYIAAHFNQKMPDVHLSKLDQGQFNLLVSYLESLSLFNPGSIGEGVVS